MVALLLASALAFTPQDAKIAYDSAKSLVERCTPRDAGTVRGRIAANHILDLASATGADVRRDSFQAMTPSGERTFTNLYAEFKFGNPTGNWVVVISHYDTKPGADCPGANDGASTTGLLIGLANALSEAVALNGNVLLVWTDGEECMYAYDRNDGFWGSRRAVEYVKARDLNVRAVICLDMLGDSDLAISIPSNCSPTLAKIAQIAAKRAGHPELVKMIPEAVKDDHVAFMDADYKAIDMIDFSYGPDNSYWHTSKDTIDKISVESLQKSGEVVAELLRILL